MLCPSAAMTSSTTLSSGSAPGLSGCEPRLRGRWSFGSGAPATADPIIADQDQRLPQAAKDGDATTAFPMFGGQRPSAACNLRGEPEVVFDLTIDPGMVLGIEFRA